MIRNRLQRIVLKHLLPILENEGYERKGLIFLSRSTGGDLVRIVELQTHAMSDSTILRMFVNLGVFSEQWYLTFNGRTPREKLLAADCCFYVRPEDLVPGGHPGFWSLSLADGVSATDSEPGKSMGSYLSSFGLPFLKRFDSLTSVITFLESFDSGNRHRISFPPTDVLRSLTLGALYRCVEDMPLMDAHLEAAVKRVHGPKHIRTAVEKRCAMIRASGSGTGREVSP